MSSNEIIQQILQACPDPTLVTQLDGGQWVAHNAAFVAFLGYGPDQFKKATQALDDLIEPDSLARLDVEQPLAQSVRFLGADGKAREAEVRLSVQRIDGQDLLFCHVTDLEEQRERESQRRDRAERYRKQNIEVARANVRLYELTERVSTTYDLTASLLNSKNIDSLMQKASAVMTDEAGLNAQEVVFVIQDGKGVRTKASGRKKITRAQLKECEAALASLEQDEVTIDRGRGVLILPLVSRGRVQGIMRVTADPAISPVFAASHEPIRTGALDIFKTLANMVSIMIDNLRLVQDLERQSIVDPLTGCYNRRFFDRKSRAEIKRALRYGEALSFLLVDIDNMKDINDQYGHQAGDRVLIEVTRLLQGHCREEDAVCRYGGDEFLIILVETPLADAERKAQSLRKMVASSTLDIQSSLTEGIRVTISSGVASLSDEIDDEEKLFHAVDQALYRAKQGKNSVSK